MEWLMQPWPWWRSGILIGLTVPLLYFLTGKAFGISTRFQEAGDGALKRNAELATMPSRGILLMEADKVMDY